MAVNRGKQFERQVLKSFRKYRNISVDRIHDQTTGYKGSMNICDFIVYRNPYQYYFECKSVHGKSFSLRLITELQKSGLHMKSQIDGVRAGLLIWFIDEGETVFIPIKALYEWQIAGNKSISINNLYDGKIDFLWCSGNTKKVFTDYYMDELLDNIEMNYLSFGRFK